MARTMRRTPVVPGSLSVVLYLAPIVMDPIAAAAAKMGGAARVYELEAAATR